MGKALLILVAIFAITGGSLIFTTTNKNSLESSEQLGTYASKLTAREVAHTGMQDATLKLSQAYRLGGSFSGPMNWKGTYQGGTYTNTLVKPDDTYIITTTATVDGQQYAIERKYSVNPASSHVIPESMTKALTSEKTITFDQTVVIQSTNMYRTGENADILTNGSIEVDGGFVCVFGFGHRKHTFDIASHHWQTESNIFLPPNNPDSAPLTQVNPGVDIPEIIPSDYARVATVAKYGPTHIGGSYTLGTEQNPVIWYVDGDLTTESFVQFRGYGIFIVNGNITIENPIYSFENNDHTRSSVAFYSSKDIKINKNVWGLQLYANGSISTSTDSGRGISMSGAMTTRDEFNFNPGSYFYLTHKLPSESIVKPIFDTKNKTIQMVSTREWAVK